MKKTPVVSNLELDLLLLYYSFSDQYGKVDVHSAKAWAKQKLGIILSDEPFTITQEHVDLLVERGILPDIKPLLHKIWASKND